MFDLDNIINALLRLMLYLIPISIAFGLWHFIWSGYKKKLFMSGRYKEIQHKTPLALGLLFILIMISIKVFSMFIKLW